MLRISKRTVAVLAFGGLLSSMATVTAHAESLKSGFTCGFTTVTDPTGQPNTQTGEINGGPILIVDDTDPTIVHTGYMSCVIQVGSSNSTANGADAARVDGPTTPLVVTVPPSQVTYTATALDNVYLCTEVHTDEDNGVPPAGDGTTWYFNDPNDPTVDGNWTTDPTAAHCGLAISAGTPDPDQCANDPVCSTIDSIVCPLLTALAPGIPGVIDIEPDNPLTPAPDGGDTTVLGTPFWDCPPYGS